MDKVRIDKWLWAARFFKTRSLASQAVDGGRVRLNGDRTKPSREVKPGDRVSVQVGELAWDVAVLALSDRRGPAETARTLYAEDAASVTRREEQIASRKLCQNPADALKGRPTKRDRRMIHRFTGDA
jgi:ribosome-associated heat shock protein Hsp15